MNYDLEKIRVACLELMGWKVTKHYDPPRWWSPADPPEANTRTIDDLPDPTRSLDDALPLMEKYGIRLGPPFTYERKWEAYSANYAIECFDESPALAVCLCALRCAGRILEDFEVSP